VDRGAFLDFDRWVLSEIECVLRLRSSDVVRVEVTEGTGQAFIAS